MVVEGDCALELVLKALKGTGVAPVLVCMRGMDVTTGFLVSRTSAWHLCPYRSYERVEERETIVRKAVLFNGSRASWAFHCLVGCEAFREILAVTASTHAGVHNPNAASRHHRRSAAPRNMEVRNNGRPDAHILMCAGRRSGGPQQWEARRTHSDAGMRAEDLRAVLESQAAYAQRILSPVRYCLGIDAGANGYAIGGIQAPRSQFGR